MNSMIALNARGPDVRPARNRAAAAQSRNAMLDADIKRMQYEQAVMGQKAGAQLRNALAANPSATPDDVAKIYMRHGMPEKAFDAQDRTAARQKNEVDMTKAQGEQFLQQSKILSQVARSINDEAGYNNAVKQMFEADVIGEDRARQFIQQGYSPEVVQQWADAELTAQDLYDRKFNEQKFNETKRHNLAAEGKPLVSITNAGDKKADELDATYYSEMYQGLQDAERGSAKRVMDYRLIDSLIGDAYSGAGANQVQSAKRLAKLVGVDVGDVKGAEAAAMVSNELALQLRSPAGGAGMPGAMSDKDREFLQGMVPGLTTTKEGREMMVEVQKRIATRNKDIAKDARDYRLKNRHLDIGFEQLIANKYAHKDMFSELSAPATAETDGPVDGQIYTDANGNRARYTNGQWDEL